MFIDTSVFIAILCEEEEAERFARAIEGGKAKFTSPLVRLEASMVLATRQGRAPCAVEADFDAVLQEAGIQVIAITDEVGRLSVEAFERYGKGRGHPAQLNLADCLSYACARAYQVPILFKGRDFGKTDVQPVPY
jgi:ribonuclease VapC